MRVIVEQEKISDILQDQLAEDIAHEDSGRNGISGTDKNKCNKGKKKYCICKINYLIYVIK